MAALDRVIVARQFGAYLPVESLTRCGIIPKDGGLHFGYLKGHAEIRPAASTAEGRALVIGQNINGEKLAELFRQSDVYC